MKCYQLMAYLILLPLLGCSATSEITKVEENIEAKALLKQAEQLNKLLQHQKNEAYLQSIPEWALKTKSPDEAGIYALGIADGSTVPLALKKAKLKAEFGLAQAFAQNISGSERAIQEENNNHESVNHYVEVIDKLVEAVPIVGAEIVEHELISSPVTGLFTSFILLRLPYDEINRVLREERDQSTDSKIQKYFDDLERRIDKKRAQSIEEKKLKQISMSESVNNKEVLQQNQDSINTEYAEKPITENSNVFEQVISKFRQ